MKVCHYAPAYFLDPQHPITVNLIGLGGTGSAVLTCLANIDFSLHALGHPGLFVRCFDGDTVSSSNPGRQAFYGVDVDCSKVIVAVTRINRAFGLSWEAYPFHFNGHVEDGFRFANVTISCVDTGAARQEIYKLIIPSNSGRWFHPYAHPYYWLDFGNGDQTGQAILGTISDIEQPDDDGPTQARLPSILSLCPDIDRQDEEDTPSCSVAQSLERQDLFVNRNLAGLGSTLIWKLFRNARIFQHGVFMNLETMQVNPLVVKE